MDKQMAVATWQCEGYAHFEVINLNTQASIFGWAYDPIEE